MEAKQSYIRRELDRILQEWSTRTSLLGSVIFLVLSPLDFFSVPELAVRFLGYRVFTAACLVATAFLVRRSQSRTTIRALIFLGVLISAITLEAMILAFAGHHSPYLLGLVLLAVVVLGLIPSGVGFAALNAGTIFVIYLVPILLWDAILDPRHFAVNTALFSCVLVAGLLTRWFHLRHLEREIGLRYDLMLSRESLQAEIAKRSDNEDRLSLFAAAVAAAAEGIFIVDLDGRIVSCNEAAARQHGRTVDEIVGRNISQMHSEQGVIENAILPELRQKGHWSGEVPGVTREGQPVLLWLAASLVRNAEGRPIAMVGLTRDLAEQKRLETEQIRTQKLESIGVLAGGVAHDFNNLLTIILGNLDLARLFAGSNPDAADALDHASEAALRAGDLTRQLITFSKAGQPFKHSGNLGRILRDTVSFAATGSSLACEFAIPADLPIVDFDEGQIRQVIHNLVRNAQEAMPGGGTLTVCACPVQVEEGEIPALPAGNYLRLEFVDHGAGIPREHLTRIFDPYFSTKGMDAVKGRGLGLAVSYSIVRNHGGAITADSMIGSGTTIAVYLPESSGEVSEDDEETAEPAVQTGAPACPEREILPDCPSRGRVLVMDDEPLVLEMAGAALRRLGYSASLCRSGTEAVVRYQVGLEAGRRFDAVILDLTVPGDLGGPETLARLKKVDPAVRAALSSGYTDHPAVRNWKAGGFAGFIAKPYSLKAFEELLAALM